MQFSLIELWSTMGPLARAVMALLIGMSLVSLAVALERVWKLSRSSRQSAEFLAAWRAALVSGGVSGAAETAKRYPRSYVAHMVEEASRVIGSAEGDREVWLEAYDRTARRIIVAAGIDARHGLGILATVGSTAPFVGLFGTVVGIISAFHTIGVTGQGGLGSVASGIAEALVATGLGILVAIPALWLFNHLTQRVQRLIAELDCVAEELAVTALTEATRPLARRPHVVAR